jgi:uncharacterized RDD family membrane protein YckC
VDGILAGGVALGAQFATGMLSKLSAGIPVSTTDQLLQSLIGVGAFLLMHGYLLVKHGQTVGKWLVGTRIVDAKTRELLPFTRVYIIRYLWLTPLALIVTFAPPGLAALMSGIGGFINLLDSLLIFGSQKCCLHDYLAGSIVVNAGKSSQP